ncbi:reverse transcriptase, partial [Tanacetum coccineum]
MDWECDVCHRQKPDLNAYLGLLQPLPIPIRILSEISMDFVEGLPKSHEKTVIFVVVDRLSKYAHFMPLQHLFTAAQVTQCSNGQFYIKLHGLPITTIEKPKEWSQWISMVEFWYNTNLHNAIKTTPVEVLYGQTPPIHMPYLPRETAIEVMDRTMTIKAHSDPVYKDLQSMCCNCQVEAKSWYFPMCNGGGIMSILPDKILDKRLGKVNKKDVAYVLVQWSIGVKKKPLGSWGRVLVGKDIEGLGYVDRSTNLWVHGRDILRDIFGHNLLHEVHTSACHPSCRFVKDDGVTKAIAIAKDDGVTK